MIQLFSFSTVQFHCHHDVIKTKILMKGPV